MATDNLEPVEAYQQIAPFFEQLSTRRKPYLDAIEKMILDRLAPGYQSLLDIGAGDGRRALRIANLASLTEIVLLEPSAAMRSRIPNGIETWPIRAEELETLRSASRRFDVITCLWNVLGHVQGAENRRRALRGMAKLLAPGGKIFLDLTYRYNAKSYGWYKTAGRFLFDELFPNENNGDVRVEWLLPSCQYRTYGHVFTRKEVRSLAISAGLKIEETAFVDYATGKRCDFGFQGNLFYVLRRESVPRQVPRALQTSSMSAPLS